MKTRRWICRYCGARTSSSADTWPELRQEPNGHFHRWERAARGRPRRDPADEKSELGPAGDTVDLDDVEALDSQVGIPDGGWTGRGGRKR
jgi:hypothetical protein